jgi:hypothetical protein
MRKNQYPVAWTLRSKFSREKYFTIYLSPCTELFAHMTARPLIPASRRRPVSPAVALVIVMVAVLLAAGCLNQTTGINQTSPTATILRNTPVIIPLTDTTIATVCPMPDNGSYWIIINPINDVKRGITPFGINGTTNLPADSSGNLSLKIVTYPTKLDPRRQSGEHSVEDYGSVCTAIPDIKMGDGCINTFSAECPIPDAESGEYFVTVSKYGSSRGDPGFAENQTQFNII